MGSVWALLFSSGLIVHEMLTELGFLMSFKVIGPEVIEDWCLTTQSQETIITVTTGEAVKGVGPLGCLRDF